MRETTSAQTDRRRAPRRRPKPTTAVTCRDDAFLVGPNLAVAVLDISAHGIRLIVRAALEKGQSIDLDLDGIGYCRPIQLSAKVVWSVPTADGNWCIGAKF
jgi:hypothetical protein